jgi:hypothetical protein
MLALKTMLDDYEKEHDEIEAPQIERTSTEQVSASVILQSLLLGCVLNKSYPFVFTTDLDPCRFG